jgi:ubiquitin-protein ligase
MHPNINEYGRFMSESLKPERWLPSMTIKNILEHIWARLAVPDIDSNECDLTRAQSYTTDKECFEKTAREYSIKYAQAT